MANRPYSGIGYDQLILRDHLATDRTSLSNERTLLAYVRTALASFVAGITLSQLFNRLLLEAAGWLLIASGIGILIMGVVRYKKMRNLMNAVKDDPIRTPHGSASVEEQMRSAGVPSTQKTSISRPPNPV